MVGAALAPAMTAPIQSLLTEIRPAPSAMRLICASLKKYAPDDAPREGLDTRPKSDQFAFDGLTLDTSTETPRACFRFSHDVDVSGKTNYADYVSFKPALKTAAEPAGKSVCFSGLAFDTDYQATLKKGLPGVDGAKLAASTKLTVAFGDKPAYVGFVGNGVILPRMEADGIGFETVNVERLQVKIYRVGDRALSFRRIVEGDNAGDNQYGAYSYGDERWHRIWRAAL